MSKVVVNKNRYTVEPLYQWDTNQDLVIFGLSLTEIPEIHFANVNMEHAIARQCSMDEAGIITVKIPNSLLQTAAPVLVWICRYEGNTFESLYHLSVPVKARKRPLDYTISDNDDELYSFNRLENLFTNTVVDLQEQYEIARVDLEKDFESAKESYETKCDDTIAELQEQVDDAIVDLQKQVDDTITEFHETIATTAVGNADKLDDHDSTEFVLKADTSDIEFTLLAGNWTGVEVPYCYDLATTYPIASYDVSVLPISSYTADQRSAILSATLVGGTDNNYYAWGSKPKIDIPVVLRYAVAIANYKI